ncbi:hypothetical protein [Nocardioides sp.]|uniref:hypothetical protein n=1 Tax=Nocardioides sp. TaxID=35761 RepID=UPI00271EC9FA|nr:hypothetical protein [Nocardioides sp.]MDO9458390.1 hypothetical protein [Nocardioides sp.]
MGPFDAVEVAALEHRARTGGEVVEHLQEQLLARHPPCLQHLGDLDRRRLPRLDHVGQQPERRQDVVALL